VLSEPLWPVGPEMLLKRCRIRGLGESPTARQSALTRASSVGLARFELATP
jgi:hypothetical protein